MRRVQLILDAKVRLSRDDLSSVLKDEEELRV